MAESEAKLKSQHSLAALLQDELTRTQQALAVRDKCIAELTAKRMKLTEQVGNLKKDVKDVQRAYEAAQAEKATTLQEKSDVLAAKAATDEQLVAAQSDAQKRVHESEEALKY